MLGIALGIIGSRWGLQGFSDTNMLVFQTQNRRVWGLSQREDPTRVVSRCSGIKALVCPERTLKGTKTTFFNCHIALYEMYSEGLVRDICKILLKKTG